MIWSKLRPRLIIAFCLGLLLTAINSSLWATNPPAALQQISANAIQLVQNGKKYYDAGQYQGSIRNLEDAVKIFEREKNIVNQAIVLSNLSLAYQKLGEWDQANQAINKSLDLLEYNSENKITDNSESKQTIIASTLNIYGGLLYQQGKVNIALDNWQIAENIYQQLNQNEGVINTQINQVKALQSLGNYQQAVILISEVQKKLDQAPLSQKVLGLKSLGELLQTIGELNQAEQVLLKSRELAKENNWQKLINNINLSLANNYWALGKLESERTAPLRERDIYNVQKNIANQKNDNVIPWQCQPKSLSNKAKIYYQEAENLYQQIIDDTENLSTNQKVKINLVNLLIEEGELAKAKTILSTVNLNQLPPSQTNIYAKINLARHLSCLAENNRSETILTQTLTEAQKLQDNKALSYAYGNLGSFYEYLSLEKEPNNQLLNNAQSLTEQALFYAQPSNSPDIAYQWQWQLGRIESRLGNQEKALSYYRNAVDSLTQVRRDLVRITADVQFSFRDNVEPVYRQLVRLLLTTEGTNPSQATLVSAISLIDSLQLAELENFLNCDLGVSAQITNLEESNNSVFIYPIILSDRLDVIYQIPNQPLQYHSQAISRGQVETKVERIRKAIARRNPEVLRENAGNLYQWLIEPFYAQLQESSEIDNLVFVLDGALRNVPMAVLYDQQNQEYLVEKDYALSLLPTSQLFNLSSGNKAVKVLGAGISEALTVEDKSFTRINAEAELQQVQQIASTETLINAEFTRQALQQQVKQGDYSILHLATHGNFSSDPQQTYLLAYNELLRANDLNNLLQLSNQDENKTIDLLILSACQTAAGDNRATLGLAGLAIRAGAKSTLASLWRVSDEYTIPLITRFYENLDRSLTKAQALHQAQKSLVYREIDGQKYQNEPYDWGAYVLVGN